jgi:hypothetical protein
MEVAVVTPPRIVILDNDQTTGDYTIFFKWLYWLESAHVHKYIDIVPILTVFTKIFEENQIFRPGLKPFLQRLAELKREKKIDYIVIYTNQSETHNPICDKNGVPITIPFLLQIMYNCLAEESIIDLRLTRPADGGSPTKSFSRVFDALRIPAHLGASKTLFFDDLIEHCPETDDIGFSENGHVRVVDYRIPFDPYLFLRLCRLTISIVEKNCRSSYKRSAAGRDLHLARALTEIMETQLFEELCEPYRQCVKTFGDPRSHGFSKYIERVEKTFNDIELIEV